MVPAEVTHDICRNYLRDLFSIGSDSEPSYLRPVLGYLRARDIGKLSECSQLFDPALHSVGDWKALRQIEAFYRKNAVFAKPEVTKEAARKSFFEGELQCSLTNRRLRDVAMAATVVLPEPLEHYIREMRHYISSVLGPFQSFHEALPSLVRVTPGATSTRGRRDSIPQLKMSIRPYVSKWADPWLKAVYESFGFVGYKGRICNSNRVELVPKNWRTDRTIACEPEGNLTLQLAFDTFAKRRLRRFGIDLSNQSSNSELARIASITGGYATVDMKNASNTVAYNTVILLFEEDWCRYLTAVRSPFYRGTFGTGTYAMFSSMGNGSTFAIETLIFAAACHAIVGSDDFLVYGDDIILPTEYYPALQELTRYLGFTINTEKTYTTGPFRESCGGDWYDGTDVTPVYVRDVNERKTTLCHLVNSLRGVSFYEGELWSYLQRLVIEQKLPLVPINESTISGVWTSAGKARDLGLLVHGARLPRRLRDLQTEYYRAYVPKTKRREFVDSRGYYLWFLNKNSQVLFGGPWHTRKNVVQTRTSEATIYEHEYVRKWVRWEPPKSLPVFLWPE